MAGAAGSSQMFAVTNVEKCGQKIGKLAEIGREVFQASDLT